VIALIGTYSVAPRRADEDAAANLALLFLGIVDEIEGRVRHQDGFGPGLFSFQLNWVLDNIAARQRHFTRGANLTVSTTGVLPSQCPIECPVRLGFRL